MSALALKQKIVKAVSGKVFEGLGKLMEGWAKVGEGHLGRKELDLRKTEIDAMLQMATAEGLQSQESAFRDFILEYEGKAADMPRFVQIVRGLIRPVITVYAVGMLTWACYAFMDVTVERTEAFMQVFRMVFYVNMVVLIFWFGDKAIQRTGLVQLLAGKKNGGQT